MLLQLDRPCKLSQSFILVGLALELLDLLLGLSLLLEISSFGNVISIFLRDSKYSCFSCSRFLIKVLYAFSISAVGSIKSLYSTPQISVSVNWPVLVCSIFMSFSLIGTTIIPPGANKFKMDFLRDVVRDAPI